MFLVAFCGVELAAVVLARDEQLAVTHVEVAVAAVLVDYMDLGLWTRKTSLRATTKSPETVDMVHDLVRPDEFGPHHAVARCEGVRPPQPAEQIRGGSSRGRDQHTVKLADIGRLEYRLAALHTG